MDFWNDDLVAKFERFRNILMGGLSYHSDVGLWALDVPIGARVLDVGCGWGGTAIQLAIGPAGGVFREAGAATEARREEIEQTLAEQLAGYREAYGRIVMRSSSRAVSAHKRRREGRTSISRRSAVPLARSAFAVQRNVGSGNPKCG